MSPTSVQFWGAAGAVIALAACGGQAGSPPAQTQPSTQGQGGTSFDAGAAPLSFTVDTAAKKVSFRLVAAHDSSNSGFNFNGYRKGRLAISVPEGWQVIVACENRGPLNHSCAIVKGPSDSAPAIAGASSPNPGSGSAPGKTDTFTFTATGQGTYRISCLVPGHEQAGMWDTFTVTAASAPPSARLANP